MSKWQVVELELFLKVLLLLEVTLIISVRPKREKLVSAEFRIFGRISTPKEVTYVYLITAQN